MKKLLPSRLRSRATRRGAALVEAAVVIPVMLVFLGCIMFADRSYEAKLDRQTTTRAGILYYASHNCEGDVPEGVGAAADTGETGTGDLPSGKATDPNRLGGNGNAAGASAGLSRSWNTAHAKPDDTPVYGTAVQDRKRVFLNRTIHAESSVACNEKPFPNKWTAIIQFIGAFARSGGGL
ncbi:MAG: hypothetical protein JWP97_2237 [Labilithrix sp.]|nr:hypothetical protein [Labilithrix sp.]